MVMVVLQNKDAWLLSPYGLVHALSMLVPGSKVGSASHAALLDVLFKGYKGESDAQKAMYGLSRVLQDAASDGFLEFCEGNSAWVGKATKLVEGYKQALRSDYDADIQTLENAAKVNSWVSKATKDKITEIIDEETASHASLILINAIYFKGFWEEQFNKLETNPLPFYKLDGSEIKSPMMYMQYEKGPAIQGSEFTTSGPGSNGVPCVAVRMNYKGGKFYAVFAMPAEDLAKSTGRLRLSSGMDYMEAVMACQQHVLSDRHVNDALPWKRVGPGGYTKAKIFLPRFEVTSDNSLSGALLHQGLGPIFKPGDFQRLTEDGNLFVSDVRQKVYVKVDEKGTEAAAVTSIVMMRAMIQPTNELFVKFDKPFHFSVIHNETGLALFTGVINAPEKL